MAYAYYVEHGMWNEVVDLFSDSAESIETANKVHVGKEGVRKHFSTGDLNPQFLHIIMMNTGIVHVDPDGKTAKGRWYGWECLSIPIAGVPRACFGGVTYENESVKEKGKWLFKKLCCCSTFHTPYEDGWVKKAELIQGIRPDTIRVLGQHGHYKKPVSKELNRPDINVLAPLNIKITCEDGGTSDHVKVKVYKA
jgi:hypothetical protein